MSLLKTDLLLLLLYNNLKHLFSIAFHSKSYDFNIPDNSKYLLKDFIKFYNIYLIINFFPLS